MRFFLPLPFFPFFFSLWRVFSFNLAGWFGTIYSLAQRASPFRKSIYHGLRRVLEAGPGRHGRKPGGRVGVTAEHHPAKQEGCRKRAGRTGKKGHWRGSRGAGAWKSARNECRNKFVCVWKRHGSRQPQTSFLWKRECREVKSFIARVRGKVKKLAEACCRWLGKATEGRR